MKILGSLTNNSNLLRSDIPHTSVKITQNRQNLFENV